MSRKWFDEFLDFLKVPPDSDISLLALPYIKKQREGMIKSGEYEDEAYSDLLRAKMIAVMESPLFLEEEVKGRRIRPSAYPMYKTYKIIDYWPFLLSPEGFVEMLARTLLAVDLAKDISYLKNIDCQELDLKIESMLNHLSSTTRKDKMKRLKTDLEKEKARRLKSIPPSFNPRAYADWQEIIAIFFRYFVPEPNKSELAEIIFNFLNYLGYEANIGTIRNKLKLL